MCCFHTEHYVLPLLIHIILMRLLCLGLKVNQCNFNWSIVCIFIALLYVVITVTFFALGNKQWHRLDAAVTKTPNETANATVEVKSHLAEPYVNRSEDLLQYWESIKMYTIACIGLLSRFCVT